MRFRDFFNFGKEKENESTVATYTYDFNEIDDHIQKVYLKRIAIDTCANFVARAVSQSEFRVDRDLWYYKLNIRPNTDMSATQFWQSFIYKLIVDNRVLVVITDSDDLLIADGWTRKESALYEDVFEGVTVKGFTFSRKFRMSEVFYLEYNNEKLSRFANGLFDDYGELYSRMLEAAKRNNQIRGTVDLESTTGAFDETVQAQLQEYVDRLFEAFRNRSIAIAPLIKGFGYQEHSNTTGTSNISVEQVSKIQSDLIDTVADAIGIPTALLHGTRAELKDNITAFNKFCLAPLLRKIEDELNAKIYNPKDFKKAKRVEVVGVNKPDIFELAAAIDKLISSSVFNPNEVRKELGYDARAGGDEYIMTKNLEKTQGNNSKGGDKE